MKNENLFQSFKNAFNGFKNTFINERNFKIHVAAAVLVICASIYLKLDGSSLAVVLLAICTVLTSELINTAIEALVDLYCGNNIHPLAKTAKDVAAAAVLTSSFFAVIVGFLVFGSKLIEFLKLF